MALSVAEKSQIAALITREGGMSALFTQIQAADLATRNTAALTLLTPAITVTVQDWPTLISYVASAGTDVTLGVVMGAIASAATAQSAAQLGPLFVALYAAVKSRGIT